jgi:hypothetical protein
MRIELSLHRMQDGEPQPLDDRRYLHDHGFATVQDEETISLETPDGGSAWVVGAGPGGWGEHGGTTAVELSIDVLSVQLAQVLHSYAELSGMIVARLPAAVYVTAADQARHLPPQWPTPVVCLTGERLFELLSEPREPSAPCRP